MNAPGLVLAPPGVRVRRSEFYASRLATTLRRLPNLQLRGDIDTVEMSLHESHQDSRLPSEGAPIDPTATGRHRFRGRGNRSVRGEQHSVGASI